MPEKTNLPDAEVRALYSGPPWTGSSFTIAPAMGTPWVSRSTPVHEDDVAAPACGTQKS